MNAQGYLVLVVAVAWCSLVGSQSIPSPPPVPVASPPTAPVQPKCSSGQPGTLSVAGRGQAEASADVAKIFLYVSIANATAEGARTVAASYATNVITAVQQVEGVSPDNVTTTSVRVTPERRYNPKDGTSNTTGYVYTNYVSIGLDNLTGDLLSEVLDTAVQNGGNNLTISSVSFSLSPALSYNKTVDARNQAANDAKATAQQFAQGLRVTLGPLLSVTDESTTSTPVQGDYTDRSATLAASTGSGGTGGTGGTSTPINIGKEKVYAAISVTYTVCDTGAS